MSFISLLLVSIGLAMDAFTVAITQGAVMKGVKLRSATKVGIFFGFFQGIMPVIGWILGSQLKEYIESIDH